MLISKTYKVAEHLFSVCMDEDSFLWDRMSVSYGPFEVMDKADIEPLFSVNLCQDVEVKDAVLSYSNKETVEEGFISMDVYRTPDGHYFELTHPGAVSLNCKLFIDNGFHKAKVALYGRNIEQWLILNTAVDFCFLLSTSNLDTVLTHSSCVVYEGKAYMFLGKSGTGKSTHSRMWLSASDNVILMNDDHPVIRLNEEGVPIAYGSPWSGKTPCYKNISAPVGGIIRISRALYNKAHRLSPIESYASLMTSCSGMTWDKELADGRDRTMQGIISKVPCYVMECLPDEEAARVCMAAVTV